MPSVSALSRWLQFVAILRVFSVVLGYFYPDTLAANLYNGDSAQVSDLQARTFATWTLTSCMLCLLCARNPSIVPIYSATLGSFLIALLHFSIEVFVYNTVSVKSAIQPMVVASVSSLWMGAGWNYYTSYVSSAPAVSEETQVTHTDKTD